MAGPGQTLRLSNLKYTYHKKKCIFRSHLGRSIVKRKGVNFGGWFSQIDCIEEKDPQQFPGEAQHIESFLTEDDISRVQSLGLDHIRLPVDWKVLFLPESLKSKSAVFDKIEWIITHCASLGIDVTIDLHRAPGHDFHEAHTSAQGLFSDPECVKLTTRIWSILAERFGGFPNVQFEVLNEPVAESDDVWNRIKDELWATVRSHAPNSTILLSSNLWGSPLSFENLTPVDDDNILYVCHFYLPTLFTHQKAPWKPEAHFQQNYDYPGEIKISPEIPLSAWEIGKWDKSRMVQSFEPVMQFMEKYQAECICNEFGVYVQVARAAQMAWLKDLLSVFHETDIGHTYWNYKNLDFGLISVNEQLHQDLPQYQNPGRWDGELADLISREPEA